MAKITLIMIINSENYNEKIIQNTLKKSVYDFELIWIKNYSSKQSNITIDDSRVTLKELEDNNLMKTLNTSINEAQGKYIIFTNSLNILLNDTLKRGYNKLEENNADLIIFNNPDKESVIISRITQEKTFNYKKIKEHIFKLNHTLQDYLFTKKYLTNKKLTFNTQKSNDINTFLFKTLLKADNILLYDKKLNNNKTSTLTINEYKEYLENLEDIKILFYKEEDKQLTEQVNNYTITQSIHQYNKLNIQYKKEAYALLRKYFIQILNKDTIDDFINTLTDKNRKDFEQIIITETVEEYELLKKVYEDKQHINFMKRYEKILQIEYKKISEFNKSLISSNSWKLTKILRIRNK